MSELKSWLKQEISAAAEPDYLNPLAVRDNLLRVMSAHVKLLPSGHDFFVDGLTEPQRQQGRSALTITTTFLEKFLKGPSRPSDKQVI